MFSINLESRHLSLLIGGKFLISVNIFAGTVLWKAKRVASEIQIKQVRGLILVLEVPENNNGDC